MDFQSKIRRENSSENKELYFWTEWNQIIISKKKNERIRCKKCKKFCANWNWVEKIFKIINKCPDSITTQNLENFMHWVSEYIEKELVKEKVFQDKADKPSKLKANND